MVRRDGQQLAGSDQSTPEDMARWIAGTEELIARMRSAPPDAKLDWVRGMLEQAVERKRRELDQGYRRKRL